MIGGSDQGDSPRKDRARELRIAVQDPLGMDPQSRGPEANYLPCGAAEPGLVSAFVFWSPLQSVGSVPVRDSGVALHGAAERLRRAGIRVFGPGSSVGKSKEATGDDRTDGPNARYNLPGMVGAHSWIAVGT